MVHFEVSAGDGESHASGGFGSMLGGGGVLGSALEERVVVVVAGEWFVLVVVVVVVVDDDDESGLGCWCIFDLCDVNTTLFYFSTYRGTSSYITSRSQIFTL